MRPRRSPAPKPKRPKVTNPQQINIPGAGRALALPDILGDWEYQGAAADVGALDLGEEATATGDIANLATQFGGDLSGLVAQGLISPETAAAAEGNQFSTMAQLGRELRQGTSRGAYQLAARGLLNSGALPGLQQQLNTGYQEATTRGLGELTRGIGDIRTGLTGRKAERRLGLKGLEGTVGQRLAQQPQYQYTPKMTARWSRKQQAYVDPWGRKFNAKGQFKGYA